MADPIGDLSPREPSPELRLLVLDPTVVDNEQVEVIDLVSADAGARFVEAIDLAFGSSTSWPRGDLVDLTGYATEAFVEAQFQIIVDALSAVMNP